MSFCYGNAFKAFLGKCNQRKYLFDWIRAQQDQLRTTQSVLSIGTGSGVVDRELANYMPNLKRYVALEPEPGLSDLDHRFTLYNTRFEDWKYDTASKSKFDLVVLCHSFYYMDDKEATIRRCMELGKRILIINECKDGLSALRRHFSCGTTFHEEEVRSLLDSMGLKYTHTYLEGQIETRDMSRDLVSFFLLRTPTDEDMAKVAAYLRSCNGSEILKQRTAVIEVKGMTPRLMNGSRGHLATDT